MHDDTLPAYLHNYTMFVFQNRGPGNVIKVYTLILYIYTVIITMATITMTTSYLGVNMEARGGGVSMSPLLCMSSSSLCFTDGSLPPDNSE